MRRSWHYTLLIRRTLFPYKVGFSPFRNNAKAPEERSQLQGKQTRQKSKGVESLGRDC